MAPSSSGSGSWAAGADIIDLDRYMRGSVRPSRTLSSQSQRCEQLVVDGGSIGRKVAESGMTAAPATARDRHKRQSHDSGVSDGSYAHQRRPHKSHRTAYRRASNPVSPLSTPVEPASARTLGGARHSSSSLRAFKTVCQQALLDQQQQIARVAELCERLTERTGAGIGTGSGAGAGKALVERPSARLPERRAADDPRPVERARSGPDEKTRPRVEETPRVPSDSSDLSSSSRSTRDPRRKDKSRTQECKTYKIIMSKLDELNRRFKSPKAARPVRAPPRSSSSSVSVCDKLVATDPERTIDTIIYPRTMQAFLSEGGHVARPRAPASGVSTARSSRPRVVTQVFNVDIAPRDVAVRSPNIATESVVKCSSSGGSSGGGDPRCGFDLEDPVHLYAQAKRLQALTATTRRARSTSGREHEPANMAAARAPSNVRCDASASKVRQRSPSLCSMCRGYWRSLRRCLVGPFMQDCKCS